MRHKPSVITAVALIILSIGTFMGCGSYLREKQLERIAKDWCLVIRASQVIPVYPLTEDLQPGDMLLVSTPVEQQVTLYKDKGFLPLDQLLGRLFARDFLETSNPTYASDFRNFYNARYETADGVIPPGAWQKTTADGKHHWDTAPKAAFPTYTFEVQSGAGLNLAIPIQGVPFAMRLMNSDRAAGTVAISKASTFGLDNWRLEKMVQDWALEHRALLRSYEPHGDRRHFLRVVSRVYVTGELNVSITTDKAWGADAAAGADRQLDLLTIGQSQAVANYQQTINTLNSIASDQLPGAKIKIAAASSRGVSFSEELLRPLVIGYVGFDMPILKGGRLGPPISTLEQLTGKSVPVYEDSSATVYRLASISHMNEALKKIQGPEADRIRSNLNKLGRRLPNKYPFPVYISPSPGEVEKLFDEGEPIANKDFDSLVDYISNANETVENLLYHPKRKTDPQIEEGLQKAWSAYKEMEERLRNAPALMEAFDFVFWGR